MIRVLFALISIWGSAARAADNFQHVPTLRGAEIEVIRDAPTTSGLHAAVVLAPGASPDIRGPLMQAVTNALVAGGFVVFRLDWAYDVTNPGKGKASPDRSTENEDLTTVLAMARRDAAVDKNRIVLIGKSLGSVVSWAVLRANSDLRGAVLITPVCHPETVKALMPGSEGSVSANDLYPGVSQETRRTQWISGNIDPYCTNKELYKFVAGANASTEVVVVPGGHSFEFKPSQANRTTSAIEIVAKSVAAFAGEIAAPN